MPAVILSGGFRIMIFTRDHEPMHVHVYRQGRKAVIEFAPEVRVRENHGLTRHEVRQAVLLVTDNQEYLISRWRKIYG